MSAARTFRSSPFGAPGISTQSLGIPAAAYPGRIATNADLIVAVDRQQTTLLLALNISATSMTVLDPSMIVAYTLLSIDNEIVKTTGPPAGNVIPISRGFDGTTPASHLAGALVSGLIDAYHHNCLVAEVEAIETALGPNLSGVAASLLAASPVLSAASYNFTPQQPGGSLIIGSNVIALAPVPPGVNGSDTSHWLYISNGVGTPEAVQITGGTAVAGAPSGTLIVTCANTHSGAWTISTATGGIAEAHQAILTAGGSGGIQLTQSTNGTSAAIMMYQGVYASSANERVTFIGRGREAYNMLQRAQSYTNGDLFHNSAHGCWYFRDIGMQNGLPSAGPVAGAGIYIGPGQAQIDNATVVNGQYGIRMVNADTSLIHNYAYVNIDMSFKAQAGISLEGLCTNIWISDSISGGSPATNANVLQAGLLITAADGVWINNSVFSADYGISISPKSDYIANIFMQGGGVDTARNFGMSINGSGFQIINLRFANVHFANQSDGTTQGLGPTIFVDPSVALWLHAVTFVGGEITSSAVQGVYLGAAGMKEFSLIGVSITDNNISNSSAAGAAGILTSGNITGLVVEGCTIGNTLAIGHQKYGIAVSGTLAGIITGNNFSNNEIAPINIGSAFFTGIFANNLGVDLMSGVGAVLASGASIAITNQVHHVSGTAAVSTITPPTGFIGGAVTLIPDAVFTWGTAGNIAVTGTAVVNKAVIFTFGTVAGKWYPSY